MVRVCIIGAGPSGLSVIFHILRLRREKPDVADAIEFVCYEKQPTFGGLWNYSWRTGLDDKGEAVHNSMYRHLWTNGPKEASLEFPDFTFLQHFGKSISSFPPRAVLRDYLEGRFSQYNIPEMITYNTIVRSVTFDDSSKKFAVIVKNLTSDSLMPPEQFDFVINCSGHFSVPNVPQLPGMETFSGRIMHSHDFRSAEEFKDKRVICVGSSYSAEDLCMQIMKFGGKSVICSYRTKPTGFNWPWGIEDRPLILNIQGRQVTFKDGSTTECDAIILCTGYLHHYPYLADNLRLTGPNQLYPDNLYKGTVWTKAAAGRMLYVGIQDQYYTFTMFDAQARWAVKYIANDIQLPTSQLIMLHSISTWRDKQSKLKDCHDAIDFQTAFVQDLAQESDYGADLDIGNLFHDWQNDKHRELVSYRDVSHISKYTGTQAPVHHTKWRDAMDDSFQAFMNGY